MRLVHVPGSPFARKVRILIRELGLRDRVEELVTTLRQPDSAILGFNPLGKVPALVIDGGVCLTESLVIADYLESVAGPKALTPASGAARWRALADDAFATALLDSIVWRMRELHRREEAFRSPAFLSQERDRARRGCDALEARAGVVGGPLSRAQITLACAFAFADKWLPDEGWREGRTTLSSWYESFRTRPAFVETTPEP